MNSGTYKYNKITGKIEKISDKIPSIKRIPDWKKKCDFNLDLQNSLKILEEKGKHKDYLDCY